MRLTTEDKFWKYVQKTATCWLWTGGKTPLGYGRFRFDGRTGYAHRYAKSLLEPLIKGFEIDHLCRNRSCVNPDHLEQVSHKTNLYRAPKHVVKGSYIEHVKQIARERTHCKRGHEFTEGNVYRAKSGVRRCKPCLLEHVRIYDARIALQKKLI